MPPRTRPRAAGDNATVTNITGRRLCAPGVGVLDPGESCDGPVTAETRALADAGAITITQMTRPEEAA